MKIIVDGKQAVLKEGSSFEYRSENPLFTDAEDYTLEIEFPMKDCPQNIAIFGALHVKGVDISTVSFSCKIETDSFDKSGILTITSVSDTMVKGQFLEGASTAGYNQDAFGIFIDEIDFSSIDGTNGQTTAVLDNWQFVDLAVWDKDEDKIFELFQGSYPLLRHIKLETLVDWIAFEAGLESCDVSVLEDVWWYHFLVVCNTTDNVQYVSNVFDAPGGGKDGFYFMHIEKTLPHWTVREFFDNLAKTFGCKAIFDGSKKSVSLTPLVNILSRGNKVSIDVNDDFEVEMQDSEDKVKNANNVKYPDDCNPNNINCCPWIYDYLDDLKIVQLFDSNQHDPTWLAQNPYADNIHYRRSRLYECLNNVGGVYGIVTEIETRDDVTQYGNNLHFVRFEVLNQFWSEKDAEDLKIYPANLEWKRIVRKFIYWCGIGRNQYGKPDYIDDTQATFANPYKMPVVNVFKYKPTEGVLDNRWYWNAGDLVEKGTPDVDIKGIELVLYDMHGAVADGSHLNTRRWEPVIGTEYAQETITATEGIVPNYYKAIKEYSASLTPGYIGDQNEVPDELPKVDESKLYRYKFLSKTLPDPKAIYVIKGKEYACLRLTAHFTVDGMSELIEGEFYEIVG